MEKELYKTLKNKYGKFSSFAIWAEAIHGEKSNIGNLEIFQEDLYEPLHTRFIIVDFGNSPSFDRRRDHQQKDWMNFHSDLPRQNEYKLRYAFKDTPLWGSFMIPLFNEYNTLSLQRKVKEDTDFVESNLQRVKEQLSYFEQPVLIALGGNVYKYLRSYFGNQYKIVVIKHPSFQIKLEEYKAEILKKLAD